MVLKILNRTILAVFVIEMALFIFIKQKYAELERKNAKIEREINEIINQNNLIKIKLTSIQNQNNLRKLVMKYASEYEAFKPTQFIEKENI
jgi:hypothetical protein